MKKRLYIETSVWNQFDQEDRIDFREITEIFFDFSDDYNLYISEVVLWEIDQCKDEKRRQMILSYIERYKPLLLTFDEEAQALRNKYIDAGVMTDNRRNRYYDTAHVAIASVNELSYLLTFNFVHLLKITKIEGFNGVNLLNGYGPIQLVSPELFIPENNEEDL